MDTPENQTPRLREFFSATLLGRTLLYLFSVITAGFTLLGFLHIYYPAHHKYETAWSSVIILTISVTAGFLISLFLAMLFYKKLIIRVRKLSDILQYLREHEDAEVSFTLPGKDEINTLAQDIRKLLNVKRITEKALRESEHLYKSVFDSSADALLLTDGSYRVISYNSAFTALTRRDDDYIIRSRFPHDYISPEDAGFYRQFDEKEILSSGAEAEITVSGGNPVACMVISSPVYIKGELCSLVRLTDITEAKNLEREKRERQMQLQQSDKLASLGMLVAGVAHEINNPNSFILFNIPFIEKSFREIFSIIESNVPDTSSLRVGSLPYQKFKSEMGDVMADMHEGAQRITKIIMDLKNIARAEPEGENETFSLKETAEGVMRLLTPQTNKRQVTPLLAIPDSFFLRGSRAKLSQVLINLITNSLEAAGPQGGYLYISVISRQGGASLEIRDTGSGILPEHMQKIFEPFFTTKSSAGGTGLGLSLSRTILQSLGWGIRISSVPGSGTTVMIDFPPESVV
ncbi:MAG: ATP-binding protein [Ignavibacteriaceae bacterium]|nr:ATP-binding protein [Ignavibacteriaceae bacterium]